MEDLTPFGWAVRPFKKCADFSGRAGRAEFWWFYLGTMIVQIPVSLLDDLLGTSDKLSSLYSLVILVPWLSVTIRRLHDTDRSWHWLLLPLVGSVALIGAFLIGGNFEEGEPIPVSAVAAGLLGLAAFLTIFVFLALPGTPGPNRFGPNPYGPESLGEELA